MRPWAAACSAPLKGAGCRGPGRRMHVFQPISANSGGKADFMTEIIRTFANG